MANEDSTGTTENGAGTDDSIAYSPDTTERDMVDVSGSLNLGSLADSMALSVDSYPTKQDGSVSLHMSDTRVSGRFEFSPEKAEWLADRLRDHAEQARE